jgi:hypothetical protein
VKTRRKKCCDGCELGRSEKRKTKSEKRKTGTRETKSEKLKVKSLKQVMQSRKSCSCAVYKLRSQEVEEVMQPSCLAGA